MKNIGRILLALFLLLACVFSLSSCEHSRQNYNIIKDAFSQYDAQNEVAVIDYDIVHWNDASLNLRELIQADDNTHIQDVMLINRSLYFIVLDFSFSSKGIFSKKQVSATVYRCDSDGENLEIVFEKNNLNQADTNTFNNVFYIKWKDADSAGVLAYHPISNTTTVLFDGEYKGSIYDFNEPPTLKYSTQIENTAFLITEKDTGKQHILDESFLEKTDYFEAISQFKHIPYDYSYTMHDQDKINVVYRLEIDRFYELPEGFTFVIFEYDCRTQELMLQSTVFSIDDNAQFLRNFVTD